MTNNKYNLSITGSNELQKGNINYNSGKFEDASKNYMKAITSYKSSLKEASSDSDPKNLEVATKKNLGIALGKLWILYDSSGNKNRFNL